MSTVKFILKNLNNTNVKLRIEPAPENGMLDAVDLWQNPSTIYIPNRFVTMCMKGVIDDLSISCDGATSNTGFISLEGDWTLIVNGEEVLPYSNTLAALNYLQSTGDFDIIIEDEVVFTDEFDFVVISYTWDSNNGKDLDTRTSITNPPRNYEVGWDRGTTDNNYLVWGGDNTSEFGPESVLIDINSIKRDFPNQEHIQVLLKAFWYSAAYNGNFNLNFVTYKGGSMETDGGYGFRNLNGSLVDDLTIQVHTMSQERVGQPLGFLDIDLESGKNSFTMYANQNLPPTTNNEVEV